MINHILILKNKKEFEITNDQKKEIIPAWSFFTQKRQDTLIKIKNIPEFQASQIQFIENATKSNNKTTSNNHVENVNAVFRKDKEEFLKLSIQEKVTKSKSFLNFMFLCLSGEKIQEESIDKIKLITIDFFKNNTKRMFPDPILYRHLINKKEPTFGSSVIFSVIQNDKYQNNKSY